MGMFFLAELLADFGGRGVNVVLLARETVAHIGAKRNFVH